MKIQYFPSPSYLHQRNSRFVSWNRAYQHQHKSNIYHYGNTSCQLQGENSPLKRISAEKQAKKDGIFGLKVHDPVIPIEVSSPKRGTIAGAVALIIGTSIGSGILALPKKTSPAVTLPFLWQGTTRTMHPLNVH